MPPERAFATLRGRVPADALAGIGVSLVALAALAVVAAEELALGPLYAAKVLAFFAVAAVLVAAQLPAHHPFPRFGPANQATLARVALAAVLAGLVGESGGPPSIAFAVGLSVGAGVLDAVDGLLARATRMTSAFGARFDMEADSALVMVLAALVWEFEKAGPWVLAVGLARYVFWAAGWVAPWLRRPLPPSFRRKTVCALMVVALVAALTPVFSPPTSAFVAAAALALLCYSFAVDALWLYRHSKDDAR